MITEQQADLCRRTAKAAFLLGLQKPPEAMLHTLVCTPETSDQDQEAYPWLGQVPQLTEWTGLREIRGLPAQVFTIPNKTFTGTIGVEVDLIERDKLGQVATRARDLSTRALLHRDRLLIDRLIQGAATNCYDGQYFFDTDHSDPGAVYTTSQTNTCSTAAATGTSPTPAEFETAFNAALNTRLRVIVDDQGEPFNVGEDLHVIVPPTFEKAARICLDPNVGALAADLTGVTGAFRGAAKIHVNKWLPARQSALGKTVDDRCYLLNLSGSMKPFICQVEKEPQFQELGYGSDHTFKTRTVLYGVEAKYNISYALWQNAVEMIFT